MRYFTAVGIAIILFGLYPLDSIWIPIILSPFHPDLLGVLLIPILGGLAMLATWGRIVSVFVCGECGKIFLSEYGLRMHYSSEHVKKDYEKKK